MEQPRSKFIVALSLAQAEMGNAVLNKTNPYFKSKYADFAAVREATLPILNKHGFAIIQLLQVVDGAMMLRTELAHESGESRLSYYPIPAGTAQAQGSAITYARRYSWSAITGIASEEDDDGNAATEAPKAKSALQQRKEGQYPVLEKGIREQTSVDGLKLWWDANQATIKSLSPGWLEWLYEEKDRKIAELNEASEDSELKKQLRGSLAQ